MLDIYVSEPTGIRYMNEPSWKSVSLNHSYKKHTQQTCPVVSMLEHGAYMQNGKYEYEKSTEHHSTLSRPGKDLESRQILT